MKIEQKHIVRCENMKVTLSLANLGNLRLLDYWMGRNSVKSDYGESTVI